MWLQGGASLSIASPSRLMIRRMRRTAVGKRMALRAGYAVVLALLVFCTVETYRMERVVSARHVKLYRQYLEADELFSVLRRNAWLAGNNVRDFFINTNPAQAAKLEGQLAKLKSENAQALAAFNGFASPPPGLDALAKDIHAFGDALATVPAAMLAATGQEQFAFLQREVSPRRNAIYNRVRVMTAEAQRALQKAEAEFADTRKSAVRRIFVTLGLCLVLGIFVARLSLVYAESLERKADRQHAETAHARGELQQLSARLLEIEEEGRKRLSRELHDEIGQTLALLKIEISKAQSLDETRMPEIRERLAQARGHIERTVQTVRNITLLLRPSLLDDLGLMPALQFQLEDFMRRSGIRCELIEENVPEHLSDSIKTCLYRIVQEALHNCEKHSGASAVRLAVRHTDSSIVLEIEDDGRGLELNENGMPARDAGLGIIGMRERAAIAAGAFAIQSEPGRGVRIGVRVPLPEEKLHYGANA